MAPTGQRFDGYLYQLQSSMLKTMARHWGGSSQMRKDEAIAAIQRGLANPAQVRAVVEQLAPYERTALALVKQYGGEIDASTLAVALRASGVPLPKARHVYSEDRITLIEPLIRRGLLLVSNAREPAYLSSYGGYNLVFSDERLLAEVGPPQVLPLEIAPVPAPPLSTFRRPSTVSLSIISLLRAVDALGGVQVTQSGLPRVADLRKLARSLGWTEQSADVDGFTFPRPALAWVEALRAADLLDLRGNTLVPGESLEAFARRSYVDQVGLLALGFLRPIAWTEWEAEAWYDPRSRFAQGRMLLMMVLAALPGAEAEFWSVDDLDRSLFERIGEHFTLGFRRGRPYAYHNDPERLRQEEAQWRAAIREEWSKHERVWLEVALQSWIYALGLVELGVEDGRPTSIRLTELGYAVLRPEQPSPLARRERETRDAWVVQPNFDVLVYLDRASPEQIAFVEQHAERVQLQQHTALYRLTRESVYHGLEAGSTPESLIEGLNRSAAMEVPQNVLAEIREWSALRERMVVRRSARLLEFADQAGRDAAISNGLVGTAVAERWLLLAPGPPSINAARRVDYGQPLPPCLAATEDGVLMRARPVYDLLLETQIDPWVEQTKDGNWRLTATSVRRALKAGATIGDLFRLLKERLVHPLPPLLDVALRAWAGKHPRAELSTVTVLRCHDPVVFQALLVSQQLQPWLRGMLAPDLLLVDTQHLPAVRQVLSWAGLDLADVLTVDQDQHLPAKF